MARLTAILAHASFLSAHAERQYTASHVAALDAQGTYDAIFASLKGIFLNSASPLPTAVDHTTWDPAFKGALVSAAAHGISTHSGPSTVNVASGMKTAISGGISQIGQCLMTQHSEMPTLKQKQADKMTAFQIWDNSPDETTFDVFAGANLAHMTEFSCTVGSGNACLTEVADFKANVQTVLAGMQAKFDAARAPKVVLDNAVVAENDALTTLKVTCKGALDNLHDELCKSGGFVELLNDQRNADADQAAAEAAQEVINKLKDDASLDFATTMHTEASLEKTQRTSTAWEYESAYKFGSGCNVLFHTATQQSNFAYLLGSAALGMPPCDIGHDFSLEELDGFCTSHTVVNTVVPPTP